MERLTESSGTVQIQASREEVLKRVSRFTARKRAENDRSNVEEFLGRYDGCARTSAAQIHRDTQIKFKKVENQYGPLDSTTSGLAPQLKRSYYTTSNDDLGVDIEGVDLPSERKRWKSNEDSLSPPSDMSPGARLDLQQPSSTHSKIAPVDSNIYGQLKRFESRILDLEQQQKKNSCCVHCFRFLVEDILVPFDDNDLDLLQEQEM